MKPGCRLFLADKAVPADVLRIPKEEHAMNNTAHLDTLIDKHHALQDMIDDEIHRPMPDQVRLTQLKREKLRLKEAIARQMQ